jgi:hypothetical protein
MTDLATDVAADAAVPSTDITFALKNGAGEFTVNTLRLPIDVYREALMQGLKAIAERNMSKLTKAAFPEDNADGTKRKAAIRAKAEANIEDMYSGKTKITGQSKAKKAGGNKEVVAEAMRLARNLVKDAIKAAKGKISHYKASEITEGAKQLIAADPSILETAKANLEARAATPVKLNVMSVIKADPKLVAEDEAKKAKAKADKPLSAKQAGKVAPRAKGSKPQPQANA